MSSYIEPAAWQDELDRDAAVCDKLIAAAIADRKNPARWRLMVWQSLGAKPVRTPAQERKFRMLDDWFNDWMVEAFRDHRAAY